MKLGKHPAAPRATDLQFRDYVDRTTLPTIPGTFGLDHVLPVDGWGMYGNGPDPGNPKSLPDGCGDCVWAGGIHETIVLTGRGATYGKPAVFTTADAINAYSECTGFNPDDPQSDQGTDVHQAMAFRQKTGIQDTTGQTHKIGAYLSLTPGNLQEVFEALYLFECVGIGIEFPETAMDQFNADEPWSVVKGAQIDGGHYIPVLSKQGANTVKVVTWGKLQTATQAFYEKYCDEAWCYVSVDALETTGKSYRGFNMAQLQADLSAV